MNEMRGQVAFPDNCAGEGFYLCFLPGDLIKIRHETKLKDLREIATALEALDFEVIVSAVKAGAKKAGKPAPIQVDGLNTTLMALRNAVLDGIFLAIHGKTYPAFLDEIFGQMKEREKDAAPTPPQGSEI
ncbi:hypothetical protein [Prosthecomicrobium hirschii]|uniref:hypothetical protein n=1 Tax=Prosthecodimorpha hirschii TaxID=665126 RepID=UPI002220BB16|nr:hypothetical protein [Prosthecomicrobium hirschii]MCW1844123.1 hypothetical protein [Prosthecomicrobium hirschii]